MPLSGAFSMPVSFNTAKALTLGFITLNFLILMTLSLNSLLKCSTTSGAKCQGSHFLEQQLNCGGAFGSRLSRQLGKNPNITKKNMHASAMPFPHIAIDGIFPQSILQKVLEENPESGINNDDGCLDPKKCFLNKKEHKQEILH
jgi:hypothetical protein